MQQKNPINQPPDHPRRPTIGLFVENTSDVGQGYHPGILGGVQAAARAQDVNLLCFIGGSLYGIPGVPFDSQRNILYDIASPDHLDGLLVISAIGNFDSAGGLRNLNSHYHPLPVVGIGAPVEGALNVTVDHKKGMVDLLVHLIEVHNYRRIAFIAGPEESPDAQIRYQVYREVLAQYDIPYDPALVAPGIFRFTSGPEAVRLLLDERQVDCDVIVAANDHMAIGAMEELQSRGVIVPYDIAVVGFDDIKQTRDIVPPVTTVRQPLHQMGEEAVNLLLARMANQSDSELITLPTEMVVRRSCGCFKAPEPSLAWQSGQDMGEIWGQHWPMVREKVVAELVDAVDFSFLNGREGAAQLLDSFFAEVVHQEASSFLSILDHFLRVVKRTEGDIASWQTVVTIMRHHFLQGKVQDELSWRAQSLLYDAQEFIAGELRTADAQDYWQTETQNWTLHLIGQSLITMFDLDGLVNTIAESMPLLGIPSCYLALYEEARPYRYPEPHPEWSRLVMAYNDNKRVHLEPGGRRFLTRHLLPEGVLPTNRRYTMMVEPLYFREEQIGFVLLERGPREGNVYEALRGQLASALKGAFLLQAHRQAETALRLHRDHLDDLVQARTAELAAANKQLRQEIGERIQAEMALQESEENLYATLHSIGDAVIATDTKSRIVRMNPVAEKLTGWTFAEAQGKSITEVFNIVHAQTGATAVDPVQRVLNGGEIVGLANHTMLVAKDKTTCQIADSAAPIRDSNLNITGVVLVFRDVSEEYRIQQKLQEREAQLRTVIETIPDLVWLKDPDGIFLICNSKVERLYGAKEADITGKTDHDFASKEVADYFRQMDLEAMATGEPIVFEEEVTYAEDGHKELIETIKTPMYDAEGTLIGVLGIARDITERKRAEAEIRESQQMLSNVLDTIPVRVFWKDRDGIFLGCNQLFAQDVGKNNPQEVIGITDHQLSSAQLAELYRRDDKFVIESGQPKINYEEPQPTPQGNVAWLNTSKIPLRNSNGEIIGVLGTYEDISERKRAEKMIRESQERLQLALQAASMGSWEWDILKDHLVWSPETYSVFGVQAGEFGETFEAYLAFVAPESRDEVETQIKDFLHEPGRSSAIQYEHKIIRGDGKSGWIETRGILFLDDEAKPLRLIGVCTDVTVRKEVEIQLEAYTAELERSNRELQEFAYVASHDLQEPLRKIQTFGDRLEQKYQSVLDERGQDYLTRMQRAAARMQALIIDLLSFSRVRTHGQPFETVDLNEIMVQALQVLDFKIAEASADISITQLPEIEADAFQIEQLFQNLLSNALKFRRLEVPLEIHISSKVVESFCEIWVVDNGIGFEEKYGERIFMVFERLHGRDSYPGTGVGLAICRRIVERHSGYIFAQSTPGEGATFVVGLPLRQSSS